MAPEASTSTGSVDGQHPPLSQTFGGYYKSLIDSGIPQDLAREIVLDGARAVHRGDLDVCR